jgi:3-hydroxyacyl-CoA dehydrogenase/enoyl-CoA hydratase/3-hydroxybutyryl-CoA epimerase
MIQTHFLGRVEYDRMNRKGQVPAFVAEVVAKVRATLDRGKPDAEALALAGFTGLGAEAVPARPRATPGYWVESERDDPRAARALAVLDEISVAVAPWAESRSQAELRIADYAAIREAGYPAYLGGPFAFGAHRARAN